MIKKIFALITCLTFFMTSFSFAQAQTKVKAIVFDFGGVIATTDRTKIIQFLTETFQLSEQELKPILGKWKKILVSGENEKEFWKNYADSQGVVLSKGWFDEYDKVTGFTDIPGMFAIVKNLQSQGFQTPMLSNIQYYQANVVRRFDYYDLFDPVLLSYEIGYEKPQREAFTFLLDKLRLSPSEVVFIDDQIDNIEAAKALGIDAIHFVSPLKLAEDLGERNIQLPKEITMYKRSLPSIQTLLKEYVDDNGSVGASVGFIDHGKIQLYSYGKKTITEDEPMSKDTIFEIGSITKVFTTLALADMVAQGMVQLDDPIEIYLPNVKIPKLDGKKITLRHLASHLSGIPRLPDNFNPTNPNNPYEDYSLENLYSYLNQYSLTRAPGESFEYSNTGMGLLGHILSMQSGKSYEELIQSLVSKQLNMKNTAISLTPEMNQNLAHGHHLQQEVSCWDIPTLPGMGALRSNIQDMTRFLAANMGFSESPLVNLMKQCHEKQCEPFPEFGVGLGWMVTHSNDSEIIWHNGGTGGFRNYLGFNPKTQRGVVILSNSTEDWPDEFGMILLDPDYKRPIVDRTLANNPDYLNKFVGSYEATLPGDLPKQKLQISVFGKLLASYLSGGECGMLYPETYGVFGVKGFPDGKVYFSFDEEGNVSKIQALLSDGTILWEAVPEIEEENHELITAEE